MSNLRQIFLYKIYSYKKILRKSHFKIKKLKGIRDPFFRKYTVLWFLYSIFLIPCNCRFITFTETVVLVCRKLKVSLPLALPATGMYNRLLPKLSRLASMLTNSHQHNRATTKHYLFINGAKLNNKFTQQQQQKQKTSYKKKNEEPENYFTTTNDNYERYVKV